jgi:hypothetical protein
VASHPAPNNTKGAWDLIISGPAPIAPYKKGGLIGLGLSHSPATYFALITNLPTWPGFDAFGLSYQENVTAAVMPISWMMWAAVFHALLESWPCTETPAASRYVKP